MDKPTGWLEITTLDAEWLTYSDLDLEMAQAIVDRVFHNNCYRAVFTPSRILLTPKE